MAINTCMIMKQNELSNEELWAACQNFSTLGELKLYIYLSRAPQIFCYERAKASVDLSLNLTTLNRAFDRLCEQNYIIFDEIQNFYKFFTSPAQKT